MTSAFEVLRECPLFEPLDDPTLATIAARCTARHYEKNETVCTIGDPADELLVIAEGEVAVWGVDEVAAHLGRPSTLGEVALLLGERRSATITTTRPTAVLVLGRADFDELVRTNVATTTAIAKILARRLQATTHRSRARRSLVCAVVGEARQRGVTLISTFVAARLTRDLGSGVVRIVLDDDGIPFGDLDHSPPTSAVDSGRPLRVRRGHDAAEMLTHLSRLIDQLAPACAAIVVEMSARTDIDASVAGTIADVVIELGRDPHPNRLATANTRHLRVHNHADGTSSSHSRASARSITVPYDATLVHRPGEEAARALLTDVHRPATRALDRLVRAVEGRVVGVALGAGAALGLAHIGVLRELEGKGVAIDMVAGSSIGGVIGAGIATGTPASELEARAEDQSSFLRLLRTVDVALTGDGLLAGNQLLKYLRPFLCGARTFADLTIPARIVATDLAAGERVAIGDGDLESAIRATIAMPPFITPLVRDGRTLVDGGIIDPIPVDVVRELGADVVIAVSAIPRFDGDAATVFTRASRAVNRVNPIAYLTGRPRTLNLLDVVMNSFHIVEHQLGAHLARDADVFIQPDVASHTWIEFYRAPEIIERGAAAARATFSRIDEVMTSRLALAFPHVAFPQGALPRPTDPAGYGASGPDW